MQQPHGRHGSSSALGGIPPHCAGSPPSAAAPGPNLHPNGTLTGTRDVCPVNPFHIAHRTHPSATHSAPRPLRNQCYQAIRAGAPSAPLAGPDTTNTPAWFGPYAAREAGAIRLFGQHYYPLGCASSGDSPAALVGTLLSPGLAASEATRFASYTPQVKRSGAPLIMTETNSACGGGVNGLSNSYAAALWVIDHRHRGHAV
jgi:hypothetical protein